MLSLSRQTVNALLQGLERGQLGFVGEVVYLFWISNACWNWSPRSGSDRGMRRNTQPETTFPATGGALLGPG